MAKVCLKSLEAYEKPAKIKGPVQQYFYNVVLQYYGKGCLKWPFARAGGRYGAISINGHQYQVHRLVCYITHGAPPSDKHVAAHSCGAGHEGCVNPAHLSWKTHKENVADAHAHGRRVDTSGEQNGMSKITIDQAEEIRSLKGLMTYEEIGQKFGICGSQVGRIIRRQNW